MAIEVFNRCEKKYMIDQNTYDKLLVRLADYMEADAYNKDSEFYSISNLYYDTPNNDLIRKSIEKPEYKEKLRLRSYGVPNLDDKVYLEIKKKYNGIVNKRRTSLILGEAYDYVNCGIRPGDKPYINKQVLREIDFFLDNYDLSPKVYIRYDRKAFFAVDDKDFRVTFDTNMRSRRYDLRLDAGDYGDPIIGPGKWLMEVKILGAAPLWFTQILSELKIYSTSFSKYGTEYKNYITKSIQKGEKIICSNQYLQQQQKRA